MDFEKIKGKKTLLVYSEKVCEELIKQLGARNLINVFYFDSKRQEGKKIKAFVFRNEPDIYELFIKLISKPNYIDMSSAE